ncbi:hypothetical protein AHS81_23075 [Salmonella enterica]|nr:hypothetical protein [Salmonella enterica]EAM8770809.1 hypothetical protein [Salmonella enterica]EAP0381007.1 hypothetical protein [Salmonella enterica]EBQ7681002.1 hypothetical protein [Salmonella enterica]HCZ5349547.1 hypothetical protein [Salmonella enterica]
MPRYYKISHSWEYQSRKPNNDVLLEACVVIKTPLKAEITLIQWLAGKAKGTMYVDHKNVTYWSCSGVLLHYIMTKKSIVLYMHSSGKSAIDSISYCAYEIAKIFYSNHPDAEIQWIEHPYKRKNLKQTSD